jgi:tetratricopeptide (TPR) repeat protein
VKELEALIVEGKYDEAERLALATKMPNATRATVLATIEMRRGDHQKAEVLFLKALSLDPGHALALGNYGQLLAAQSKFKQALPRCEAAFKKFPKNEIYALNYANCLADADRIPEGIELLRPFTNTDRPSIRALTGLSALLRANLEPEQALSVLELAQSLYPDEPELERSIADVLAELDPKKASRAFGKVEKLAKNKVSLRWNWSFVELRLGNFKKGWDLYEAGLSDVIGKIGRPLPAVVRVFDQCTRLEELDPSKYTLFICEQGIGDQVLFLGCFERVLRDFPKAVLIAEDRMLPILRRSYPNIAVETFGFAYSLAAQKNRLNGIFPIGSFQRNLRDSAEAFRRFHEPYLSWDKLKSAKYREIIEKRRGKKELIGISWTGGFWDRQKKTKSFPIEAFSRLMKDDRYTFVALQYGDVSADKEFCEKSRLPVTFFSGVDFKKDLDSWFALACACDRIISVSTALVHFAGAAGMRVDVLMGSTQGPFIWGLKDGPSLPYRGVSTWRKKRNETVEGFFDRMRDKLL